MADIALAQDEISDLEVIWPVARYDTKMFVDAMQAWRPAIQAGRVGAVIAQYEDDVTYVVTDAMLEAHALSSSLYEYALGRGFFGEESVTGAIPEPRELVYYYESRIRTLTRPDPVFVSVFLDEVIEYHLEGGLLRRFVPIQEVDAIYTGRYLDECRITVLLSSEVYDDALMDRLLENEYEIHNTFPHLVLSFTYAPFLGRERSNFVHPSSRLIFNR